MASGRLARVKATLLPLLASGVVAVALAIVPIVMSALLAAQSNRPDIGFGYAGLGSLHPAHLLMLMFADLYGASDPAVEYWGPPSPVWSDTIGGGQLFLAQNMGEVYCGILAVLLIAGMGIARGLLWAREIRFFLIALAALPRLRARLVHSDLPRDVRRAARRRPVPAAGRCDLRHRADDRGRHRLPRPSPAHRYGVAVAFPGDRNRAGGRPCGGGDGDRHSRPASFATPPSRLRPASSLPQPGSP